MTDVTSVSLLGRVRDTQDTEAWQRFAGLYEGLIRHWLSLRNARSQDVDDVTQEVMSYVFRSVGTFEHNGRPGAFRNWLRQITANKLRDFWRSRQRRPPDGAADLGEIADELADENSGVSRIWREEYDRYVVDHLLSQVAERFQQNSVIAFRKVVLHQLPAAEVAHELDMSLGAVRVAQSRVLRALRQLGEGLIDY